MHSLVCAAGGVFPHHASASSAGPAAATGTHPTPTLFKLPVACKVPYHPLPLALGVARYPPYPCQLCWRYGSPGASAQAWREHNSAARGSRRARSAETRPSLSAVPPEGPTSIASRVEELASFGETSSVSECTRHSPVSMCNGCDSGLLVVPDTCVAGRDASQVVCTQRVPRSFFVTSYRVSVCHTPKRVAFS